MRIGTVRMAHVTGDGIGAAERLVIMKNAFAFRNEAIGRFFPDLLVTLGKGAVGLELTPGGAPAPGCWAGAGASAAATTHSASGCLLRHSFMSASAICWPCSRVN